MSINIDTLMNKRPLCDSPADGRMLTATGYRLCCNPEHRTSPDYETVGPQWHPDWLDSDRN